MALYRIATTQCQHTRVLSINQMHQWLAEKGLFRRNKSADDDIVLELFKHNYKQCEQCSAAGIQIHNHEDEWDDFGGLDHANCTECNKTIDALRLEVFPNTRVCSACQRLKESGQLEAAVYCDRCGDAMQSRQSTAGITRYQLSCPTCGYKP